MKTKCAVCGENGQVAHQGTQRQTTIYNCPRCKAYEITEEAEIALEENPKFIEKKYILIGILRNKKASDKPLLITTKNFKDLINMIPIPVDPFDAIDKILIYIYENASSVSMFVKIESNDYPIVYGRKSEDLEYYISHAEDMEYIERGDTKNTHNFYRLLPSGWKRLSEIRNRQKESSKVFVAMSFSNEMDPAWENGFYPAIKSTGYDPFRVDKVEHIEKIDDFIILEIRKSGLLVADFTENKPGVYFEAGFAMGLGIPVIWCARDDYKKKIHFDTRQYNHIFWEDPSDLKEKLALRIEATVPLK